MVFNFSIWADLLALRCINCFGPLGNEFCFKDGRWHAVCKRCDIEYPLNDNGTIDEEFIKELRKNLATYYRLQYEYYSDD